MFLSRVEGNSPYALCEWRIYRRLQDARARVTNMTQAYNYVTHTKQWVGDRVGEVYELVDSGEDKKLVLIERVTKNV